MNQIKPLPQSAPIWEYETSDYPDLLKVPMENGHVITYRREIEQPEPRVMKCIDLIKLMKDHTFGGEGRHAKKSR